MKNSLMIALALCTSACSGAADQYQFEEKEYDIDVVQVTKVEHPSINDLRSHAPAAALKADTDLMAFSLLRPGGRCEIHIVDPTVSYHPEWLGHEQAHCFWGRWHPKRNLMEKENNR